MILTNATTRPKMIPERKTEFITTVDRETFNAVLQRVLPLIGASDFLSSS
jgi:hypothetical protein